MSAAFPPAVALRPKLKDPEHATAVRVLPLASHGEPDESTNDSTRKGRERDELDAVELMERVRDGDVRAFEQLVERYWSRTLVYVRHLSRDADWAYEVTQEAFSRLWERRREWKAPGSVRVWLLRTARNIVISDQRKWQVRARRALEVAQEYRPVRTPLEDAERMELRSAIQCALRKLSPRRREVFTLFHLHGLSYREISAIMGLRPQTAANYLQAALADLRKLLAPHFGPETPGCERGESGSIDEVPA
jgi:RNA polymerase sigma-70 factor, ECF subfamily